MKRVLEKHVKAALKRSLERAGAYQHWPVQNGMGAPCLDCHGCYRGLYFAVETKAPGADATERQRDTMKKIEAAGGRWFLVDTVEEAATFERFLYEYAERRDRNP